MSQIELLKTPYLRNDTTSSIASVIDPLVELDEDELLSISGAKSRWFPGAEVIATSLLCYGGSVYLGNKGFMCTTTVECQNQCK